MLKRILFSLFREGIKVIGGKAGVQSGLGRLIMTKNITMDMEISEFIKSIVMLLSFPGRLSVDLQGFVSDPFGDQAFQFASQNSALKLQNEKKFIHLDSTKARKETIEYFQQMNNKDFLNDWFENHNRVSALLSSGFKPARLTSIVVFYEPSTQHIETIFKIK